MKMEKKEIKLGDAKAEEKLQMVLERISVESAENGICHVDEGRRF